MREALTWLRDFIVRLWPALVIPLHGLRGAVWDQGAQWRNPPRVGVAARFVNMQDNGKAYRRALHDFDQYCIPNRLVLVWSSQVDAALHAFIYPMQRSRVELVHAAVLKAFPGLRGLLPCSVTAVREKAEAQPVTHHPPLPWGAVVLLAEGLRSRGLVRSGAGLLLMWRLGLRPGEFTQLGVEDLWYNHFGGVAGPPWPPAGHEDASHRRGPSPTWGLAHPYPHGLLPCLHPAGLQAHGVEACGPGNLCHPHCMRNLIGGAALDRPQLPCRVG